MTPLVAAGPQLLAGPPQTAGAESHRHHHARLGPVPAAPDLVGELERSGLVGRGGAAFPVAAKWRSVTRGGGPAVVLANGAEGEPLSRKDVSLMAARPHLVLDGAFLAAAAVGAPEVVVMVAEDQPAALRAMAGALAERPGREREMARLVPAPARYVAGESSAAVNLVNTGYPLPTSVPPRPHQSGIAGRPTLVQNVETLAHVALIARRGGAWYRDNGTILLTVHPGGGRPAVLETPLGTALPDALAAAGRAPAGAPRAVLLGGYFGTWVPASRADGLVLDPVRLRSEGLSLGCGVLAALDAPHCGVCETARVMRHLSGESSAQCGPCFFGLRALADSCERIASDHAQHDDFARLVRWSREVRGRGACHHPDGAVTFLQSALEVFGDEFADHSHHSPRGRWP